MTVFRVDNPHTKPIAFWRVADRRDPPRRPRGDLPRRGLHPPRRHARAGQDRLQPVLHVLHLEERALGARRSTCRELAHTEEAQYFRPNFFVNTPDILTDYLADGGPPAFPVRLVLAATLSPSYGVYSGFEHFEHVQRPGSEEYLDNEKYELKARRLDGPAARR